jgi:hypothetical protein
MGAEDDPQTHSLCPYCGKTVDPDAPDVIFAREQLETPDVEEELPDRIEGRGAFFHQWCPPELVGWVRRAPSG